MKKLIVMCAILVLAGCGKKPEQTSIQPEATQPAKPENKWSYSESKDEMRGEMIKILSVDSANTVDLSFPYDGGAKLSLMIIKPIGRQPIIGAYLEKGQLSCSNGCLGALRFGSSPVEMLTLQQKDDPKALELIVDSKAFMANMRNIKKLVIELPFYQDGSRQFTFDLTGFSEAEAKLK